MKTILIIFTALTGLLTFLQLALAFTQIIWGRINENVTSINRGHYGLINLAILGAILFALLYFAFPNIP